MEKRLDNNYCVHQNLIRAQDLINRRRWYVCKDCLGRLKHIKGTKIFKLYSYASISLATLSTLGYENV